jgi:hypothetical protein
MQARMDDIEVKVNYIVLIVDGVAHANGVNPSTLPSYTLPPPPRYSPTPSLPSPLASLSVGDGPSNPSSRSSSALGMFHFMHYKIYLTLFAGRASQRGSPATHSRGRGRSPNA